MPRCSSWPPSPHRRARPTPSVAATSRAGYSHTLSARAGLGHGCEPSWWSLRFRPGTPSVPQEARSSAGDKPRARRQSRAAPARPPEGSFFRTQLEALERLADHRQADRHARSRSQALAVLAQQRVIVLDHELAQHFLSGCIQARGPAAAVRLGSTPALLALLATPVGDRSGTDLEAAGNLDLRKVATRTGDQNTLTQIRRIRLGHGSPPGPYPRQRTAHPNGFKPRSKAL